MQKSVATFTVKSVSEEKREIEGIASTPTPDRVNDVIDPMGLTTRGLIPLLLNHKPDEPVGSVTFGRATAKGLPFKAKIAKITEPGTAQKRTDEAWHSVKHGLIKGVSIGFIPRESKPLPNGGTHYTKAEVHELSLTAVPCNPEARITAHKAADVRSRLSSEDQRSWDQLMAEAKEQRNRADQYGRLLLDVTKTRRIS